MADHRPQPGPWWLLTCSSRIWGGSWRPRVGGGKVPLSTPETLLAGIQGQAGNGEKLQWLSPRSYGAGHTMYPGSFTSSQWPCGSGLRSQFLKEMGPRGLTTLERQSQDLNPSSSLQRASASPSVFLFHLLYKYLTQLAPTNSRASKASALKVTAE